MKQKPVIIVCGANHSGTSMVAKLLLDNGAWTGDYDEKIQTVTPYVKYEDHIFKQFCQETIGQIEDNGWFDKFKIHLTEIPFNQVVMFKYPKSAFILGRIREIIDRPIKVVFVIRNPGNNLISLSEKAKSINEKVDEKEIFKYMCITYKFCADYDGDLKVVMFERLLKYQNAVRGLLYFCELFPKKIDYSGVIPELVHYGV